MTDCSSLTCDTCTGQNSDLANCLSGCTTPSCVDSCNSTYTTSACICQDGTCMSGCNDSDCQKWFGPNSSCNGNGVCNTMPCDNGDCSSYGDNFTCVDGQCTSTPCVNGECPSGSSCNDGGYCVSDAPISIWVWILIIIILIVIAILLGVGIKKLWSYHKKNKED